MTGTFLERFERIGLKIVAIKVIKGTADLWDQFYPSDNQWYHNAGSKTLENCQRYGIDVQERLGTTDPVAIGKLIKQWLVDRGAPATFLTSVTVIPK